MADRPQTTRVSLTAAPSRGWVTLRCVPQGLTAPALVTLGACDQSESEPFARLTVGPAYPVVRAMYVPSRLPELDMQVFAPHGTVQLTFEELDGAFGLLGAMWTRLRGLRHLGPRAIAARGLGLSKRLRARNEPVGMLPLEVAATAAEWLTRYHSPVSDGLAEPGSGSGRMGPDRRALLVDARGASPADLARTLTAVAHGDDPPPDVVCLRGESALPPDDLDRLRDCRLLLWLEAGEEPRAHALSCLAEAAVRAGGIAFADWIDVEAHGGERIVVTPGWDPVRAASGYTPEGGIAIMGKALSDALGHLGSTGPRTRRADLLSALATNAEPGTIAHVASPLTRVPARLQARGPASARSAMRRPFASLVIPTHARAGMLNRGIASCFDSSSYGALELVVVDHAGDGRGPDADSQAALDPGGA